MFLRDSLTSALIAKVRTLEQFMRNSEGRSTVEQDALFFLLPLRQDMEGIQPIEQSWCLK